MTINHFAPRATSLTLLACILSGTLPSHAADSGWSVVPYVGYSQLGDQTPDITGAENISDGRLDIAIESGFAAGLSVRYDYQGSPWISEFGWEYRSNDATATTINGTSLPGGNYASNTFYVNGRYALQRNSRLTSWLGGGLSVIQEIDLDSESAAGERSFSDGGSVGFQIMAGADYDLTDRLYFTGELRYSSQTALDLAEEGGDGVVSNIDYQPITLGLGIGYRF